MSGRCSRSGIIIFLLIVSLFSSVSFSDNSALSVNLEQDISASSAMNNGEYESTSINFYTSNFIDLSGDYIEIHAADGTGHVFWFDTSGGDAPPQSSHTMHKIGAFSLTNNSEFAQALSESIDAIPSFEATVFGFSVNVINTQRGDVEDANTNALGNEILVTVSNQGENQRVDPGIDWSKSLSGSTMDIQSMKSIGDNGTVLIGMAKGFDIDNCNDQSDLRYYTIFFFDSDGICQWFRKTGTEEQTSWNNQFSDLEIGNDGIFVKGVTEGDIQIAGDSITEHRTFIAKISFSGIWQWAVELPDNYMEYNGGGIALGSDDNGGLIISRNFEGQNIQLGDINLNWEGNSITTFIAKISSQGDFEWAKTVGDAVGNTPYDIEWQSNNQIIWVGSSYSSETGGGSSGPVKFAIFDHSGELITEAITSIQNSTDYYSNNLHMYSDDDTISLGAKAQMKDPEKYLSVLLEFNYSNPTIQNTGFGLEGLDVWMPESEKYLFQGEGQQSTIPLFVDGDNCGLNYKQWGGSSHTETFFANIQCFADGFTNWSTSLHMTEYESYLADSHGGAIYTYTTVAKTLTKMIAPSKVDADNDSVLDVYDSCLGTSEEANVDTYGCSVYQYDWDDDGITNSEDPCPQLLTNYCGTEGEYLIQSQFTSLNDIENYQIWGSNFYNFDISNDGSLVALHTSEGLFMLDDEGNLLHDFSVSIPELSKIMFNQNSTMFFMLTEGMFRVYDTLDYSILYQNGNDNRCNSQVYLSLSQNNKKVVFQAPCQSNEMIEVNLQTWESSTYAQPGDDLFVGIDYTYSEDGDYFSGFRHEINLLMIDGTYVRRSFGHLEIFKYEEGWLENLSNYLQAIPEENLTGIWPVGDQSSILFVSGYSDTTTGHDYDFELKIYNSTTGEKSNIDQISGHTHVFAKISEDGSRIFAIGLRQNASPKTIEGFYMYERDRDSDGFVDSEDMCPWVQGEFSGCLEEFFDSDNDGVNDRDDQCAGTVDGVTVNSIGCAMNQLDSDGDGISDASDQCPNTPNGESVGLTGCSGSEVDTDEDGIYDSQDNCPSTPSGTTVDSTGCAPDDVIDLDSDGDGVRDSVDTCPNSEKGIIVDSSGCETSGDVQETEKTADGASDEEFFKIAVGCGALLLLLGIASASFEGLKKAFASAFPPSNSNNSNSRNSGGYSGLSDLDFAALSEGYNPVTPSFQSESEINQLRQQEAQQSSALEIAAMQREMQALQQRVEDSEQAKVQLKNEIEQVKIQKDESINMQDSVIGGDVVSSGGHKIESQTNISGIDSALLEKLLDRERQAAEETARMKEELARLRKEQND